MTAGSWQKALAHISGGRLCCLVATAEGSVARGRAILESNVLWIANGEAEGSLLITIIIVVITIIISVIVLTFISIINIRAITIIRILSLIITIIGITLAALSYQPPRDLHHSHHHYPGIIIIRSDRRVLQLTKLLRDQRSTKMMWEDFDNMIRLRAVELKRVHCSGALDDRH